MIKKINGFSLVEVLIAMGVGTIVMLAFGTWISNVSREQQSLSQKMATVEIQNTLMNILGNSNQCDLNFKPVVAWPTGTPPLTIPVPNISLYNTVTGLPVNIAIRPGLIPQGFGLSITTIQLQNIRNLGAGLYKGDLAISYGGGIIARPPAMVPNMMFSTSVVGPNDTLVSCSPGIGTSLLAVDVGPPFVGGPVYPLWTNHAGTSECPPGMVATGIFINTSGTAHHNSDSDGPIIQSVHVNCRSLIQ